MQKRKAGIDALVKEIDSNIEGPQEDAAGAGAEAGAEAELTSNCLKAIKTPTNMTNETKK